MQRKLATLALLSMVAVGAAAAPPQDDPLVFVTMKYANRAQLQMIASQFQHLVIDDRAKTASVEATHDEIIALRRAGIDVRIDDAATKLLRQSELQWQGGSQGVREYSISGYPCYRTVDETYATMDQLAQSHPGLAKVVDIGPSWLENRQPGSGHRMRALVLTNAATNASIPDKPVMAVFASIHAREYTPAELLTRFAEGLVNGYGTDPEATWLLDNFRFHLILQANPDGRVKAESGLSWRKNVDNLNGVCSAATYGIDLNRNFPFQWNQTPGGSSGNACASTYRGPSSTSETESQDLFRYIAGTPDSNGVYHGGVFPDRRSGNNAAPSNTRGMFIDLHSYAQVVLWPWAYTTATAPNATALQTLGRRLAWYNGYKPEQWIDMYAADGTTTDTMYGLLGVPSYTLEMGVAFFEDCSTFESSTLPKNTQALRFAARNLWAPYLYPSGPTTTAMGLSPATVGAGTPVTVTATINDSRFSKRNGTEPVQAIRSATAYLDQQPWTTNPIRHAMQASDGSFDELSEQVNIRLSTTGLAHGRHVVFVQGTDASGRAGTPQAAYFNVQ